MPRLLQFCFACLLVGAGCSRNSTQTTSTGADAWTNLAIAKVIGYSFDGPTNAPGWTLLKGGTGLDRVRLKQWTKLSTELTAAQVPRLIEATFKSKEAYQFAACYAPRNIFVFYDSADQPVAAIEICFTCDAVATWPVKDCKMHHDFSALARLSTELSLGVGSRDTLEEYLMVLKERHGK